MSDDRCFKCRRGYPGKCDCTKSMTLPLDKQIEEIRAACIKANPEIVEEHAICCQMDESQGYVTHHLKCESRPIRFADVLLALQNKRVSIAFYGADKMWIVSLNERDFADAGRGNATWNLRADDITQQSPKFIAFIHSLLHI